MPIYKAFILNKEISVNYVENEKNKLVEAVKSINSKLENYNNHNGKVSDNKLLSFLAIKLQAELTDLKNINEKKVFLEKKYQDSNTTNISLNDKLYELSQQNELLKKENNLINQELTKIESEIDIIIGLIKKTYEE